MGTGDKRERIQIVLNEMRSGDWDFIQRINVKDEEAFRELFLRFRDYLVVFAMRYVDRLEVAEDLVQDVFIMVWESKKIYTSYQGFKAYLYESVQNKSKNYLKHQAVKEKYVSYIKTTEEESEDEYDLMQEEIYRELYVAVRKLPEKCRKVFELALEGKKNDEIAEILEISVLTVKSHKQNALHFLKENMRNLFLLYLYIYEA